MSPSNTPSYAHILRQFGVGDVNLSKLKSEVVELGREAKVALVTNNFSGFYRIYHNLSANEVILKEVIGQELRSELHSKKNHRSKNDLDNKITVLGIINLERINLLLELLDHITNMFRSPRVVNDPEEESKMVNNVEFILSYFVANYETITIYDSPYKEKMIEQTISALVQVIEGGKRLLAGLQS